MIAPNRDLLDISDARPRFQSQLHHGTVLVNASHRGEVFGRHIRCRVLANQRIGVARVAHDDSLAIAHGVVVDGSPLVIENLCIVRQQINTLD